MTDSQLDSSPTPLPEFSSSPSRPASLSRDLGAVAVSLATVGVLAVGWYRGLLREAPWWAPPLALLVAGMGASERARLVGTLAPRLLRGSRRKD